MIPDNCIYIIENANHIAVLTGAGISAESGIPTFRGQGGYWRNHRPEELATPEAFAANPRLVWEWYQFRRETIRAAQPNAGHRALAEWERIAGSFTLITQNVDDLHRRAGSRCVLELHGRICWNRCVKCGAESTMDEATFDGNIPHCPCGGILRPAVVWFGEPLPERIFQQASEAVTQCDVMLSVGTSSVVYPAAALPEIALRRGIPVIEVNPEPTPFSAQATLSLRGRAGEILPKLAGAYAAVRSHRADSQTEPS